MNRSISIIVAGGLFVVACNEPAHMQRTYAQAYTEAFTTQADLARPSAKDAEYALTGAEGVALRENVAAATTDVEAGVVAED